MLGGCLPDEKDPGETSNAGKMSGVYYAAGLGNLAIQIQNKLVSDTTWFSGSATLELPLQSMDLQMADLGMPVRSFACPVGNGTQIVQFTWLDGRDQNGKFTIKGIGADPGAVISALRERAGGENVGTSANGTTLSMSDGKTMDVPASCGTLPIPTGAPVVTFKIDRPAKPLEELSRKEYRTTECPNNERGTMVQSRVVTYGTDGTISSANWGPEDMGSCVQDVDISMNRTTDMNAASANLNSFANVSLKQILEEQLKMGCVKVSIKSNIRDESKIDTCTGTSISGDTALAAQGAANNLTDRRTLSCINSSQAPLTGIVNVGNGINTTYTWESGTAVIVRNVNANNMNNGSVNNDIQQWIGSDAPGDLNCAGYEEVEIPCSAITEGRAAYTPQQDGTMWHSFNTNPWNHWNVNVVAMSRNYFTGTFQYKNGNVTLRRPITATKWADKVTFKPQVDGQTWTIVKNECVVAQRALYPEKGCAPTYNANDLGNPTGNWYPSNGAGHRPRTIIDDPIQFTGDANTLPSRFQQLRNMGYLPQRGTDYLISPAYLYSYPFGGYAVDMKQWVGNNYHDTLLGLNGIMYAQVPNIVNNNKLVYTPMDKTRFAEPYTCGRNQTDRALVPAVILTGPTNTWNPTPTQVWATVNTYREWRGYAYNSGSWSQAYTSYTPDQGYWSGGVAIIDQRVDPWTFEGCMQSTWQCWNTGDGGSYCGGNASQCCGEAVSRGQWPSACWASHNDTGGAP